MAHIKRAYNLMPQSFRSFSQKLVNSPRNTVVAIPDNFSGERLDKFMMSHFKMNWAVAHKLIRTKKAFVV